MLKIMEEKWFFPKLEKHNLGMSHSKNMLLKPKEIHNAEHYRGKMGFFPHLKKISSESMETRRKEDSSNKKNVTSSC